MKYEALNTAEEAKKRIADLLDACVTESSFCNSDGKPVTTVKMRVFEDRYMCEAIAGYLVDNGVTFCEENK